MRVALVVLLLLVAGGAHADPKIPVYSAWVGTYDCAQGTTALELSIESTRAGVATAKFAFGPTKANPRIPSGAYWMTGTLKPGARGQLDVRLVPDRWSVQPPGYVMVGITATIDVEQRSLTGTIDFAGCGRIAVTRVRAERD